MHHIRICVAAVVLALATTAASAEPSHTIRVDRPVEVGHSFHVRATGSTDIVTTVVTGGGPENVGAVKVSATLDAVAQVLTVDDAGRPIGIAYTINECKMKRHEYTSTIVPQGATLIARQGDNQTRFFLKKKRFTELEQQALETVAGMDTYQLTKDQMFGSDRPRSVGEQWPINSEAVAMEFQRYTPQTVDPENINGSTMLVELMEFEGRRCQVVRTEFNSTGALPGFTEMPTGTRLKAADIKATTFELLPVEMEQPRAADKVRVEMDITFSGDMRGETVEGRIKGIIQSEHTFSPVTPAHAAVNP